MGLPVYYTPTALADMHWFRQYYHEVFPQGQGGARRSLQAAAQLLSDMPQAGRLADDAIGLRQLPLQRTPFALLYRVGASQVQIIRVIDTRANITRFGAPTFP